MSDRQANFLGLGRREGRWHVVGFFALGLLGPNGLDYWRRQP